MLEFLIIEMKIVIIKFRYPNNVRPLKMKKKQVFKNENKRFRNYKKINRVILMLFIDGKYFTNFFGKFLFKNKAKSSM